MLPRHRVRDARQFGDCLRQRVVAIRDTHEPAEAADLVEEAAEFVGLAAQALGEHGEAGLVQARLLQHGANGIVDDGVGRTQARHVAGQV